MRDKSEITDLFKNRLEHAELEVRDGFWETLERDVAASSLSPSARPVRRRIYRWAAAAASVLLVLGIAMAVWRKPAPQEGREAVRHLASAEVKEPESRAPEVPASPVQAVVVAQAEPSDGQPLSVHVSITITQRQYGGYPQERRRADNALFPAAGGYREAGDGTSQSALQDDGATVEDCATLLKNPRWALKAGIGTSLPKGGYHAPLTAGLSLERRLNRRLSLEAGVQYSRLAGTQGETLHTLGIPVRLNVWLAGNDKVDFYAMAGGAVEKCVAGAPDNSFEAEPVQCSVMAGLGVRYKMSDRLALFAEPTVSHHFDSDASTPSLRTERPTNLNLLCGLRMAF